MDPLELLDGDMLIEHAPGFLRVWHRRAARDVPELEAVLAAIDTALESNSLTRLMFDSRESEYQGGEVQTRMWDWLQSHPVLTHVATLVKSELLATSVNMTGVSKGLRIKAFHDLNSAADWLRR